MNGVPRAFVRRLNSHNRHALLGALFSLMGAILVWGGIYWGGQTVLLLGLTSVRGDAAQLPTGYFWGFSALVALLLTLAAIDRTMNPFPRPDDRPILGWHLIKQVLLLPALLTFAVYDNLNAYRRLSPSGVQRAWELLREIQRRGKVTYSGLGQLGLEPEQAEGFLLVLQFAGYIDLHHGRDEWFYLVRSSEAESLKRLVNEG